MGLNKDPNKDTIGLKILRYVEKEIALYTVGIVDDERTTREYLSALVDWESLGMEVVFTAKDGIDRKSTRLNSSH